MLTSKPYREFMINADKANGMHEYGSNYVRTTKYTVITFLPKSLLIQFRRLANIYFLITAIIQFIPAVSPLTPWSGILPLAFVLAISMLREGIEDYGRYQEDLRTNSQPIRVLNSEPPRKEEMERKKAQIKQEHPDFDFGFPACFDVVRSQDLRVGQVVLICEDEVFPADLVLLGTSDKDGKAYIETAMLDGEKSLKLRTTDPDVNPLCHKDRFIFHAKVRCERPTHELDRFGASIFGRNVKSVVTDRQLLMKGAKLKNTQWITGVVTFTGEQTKLLLNANRGRMKQSRVEHIMNNLSAIILLFQTLICIVIGILSASWQSNKRPDHYYIDYNKGSVIVFVISFFSHFLLLNTLIPISLIVTLEIVKFMQLFFIQWDVFMYRNDHYAKVSTCSINEELGQVKYIFSDKTGTLTCNKMELKSVRIFDKCYGEPMLQADGPAPTVRKLTLDVGKDIEFGFADAKLDSVLTTATSSPAEVPYAVKMRGGGVYELRSDQDRAYEFFKMIACCHEVSSSRPKDGKGDYLIYAGQSPDEVCLVDAAQRIAVEFVDNRSNVLTLKVGAKDQSKRTIHVNLLASFPFDSYRARMSVIIRDEDGSIKLYCKGSDERLSKLLTKTRDEQEKDPMLNTAANYLDAASGRGLRTLYMAMRVFGQREFEEWDAEMKAVSLVVPTNDAEVSDKRRKIDALVERAERDLTYLGCTVVEDKLQENVENTIHNLEKAGIRVWMITGDKMGTARSIGYSCKMFTRGDMDIAQIDESFYDFKSQSLKVDMVVQMFSEQRHQQKKQGLLITGALLEKLLGNPRTRGLFIKFAKACNAVVCCRTTASQKAAVVRAMKDACPDEITLAIGDGGNDVPMINEAHVGVGIYGKEGMQAAQSADYAIGEFQCLWNLLMIHGRLAYMRIAELILYFFYKNAVFTLPQLYYSFFCAYSGQTFYDDWYISFYNLFFTSIPLLLKALFDHDIHHIKDGKMPLNRIYPFLYLRGQANQIFNASNILMWFAYGILHSCVAFFLPYAFLRHAIINDSGENTNMWFVSITSFTAVIVIVDLKLYTIQRFFNWLSFLGFFALSLGLYLAAQWASNGLSLFKSYHTVNTLYHSPMYYLSVLLCVALVFTFDHFIQVWNFHIVRNTSDLCRMWSVFCDPVNVQQNAHYIRMIQATDTKERGLSAAETAN